MLDRNEILFNTELKVNEDWVFNIYAFGAASKVAYIKDAFYYYMYNPNSLIHSYKSDSIEIANNTSTETEKALHIMCGWGGEDSI